MAVRTANLAVDCADPRSLATWWGQVLDDYARTEGCVWEEDEAELLGPGGRAMVFVAVPEPKRVKNRLHLCLRPVATTRDVEIARLLGLGAALVQDLRDGLDAGWAVLADPEGNEFCVLTRSADQAGVSQG